MQVGHLSTFLARACAARVDCRPLLLEFAECVERMVTEHHPGMGAFRPLLAVREVANGIFCAETS